MLNLSHEHAEHTGFIFEKNFGKAANLLEKHSGGNCSQALRLALENKFLKIFVIFIQRMGNNSETSFFFAIWKI